MIPLYQCDPPQKLGRLHQSPALVLDTVPLFWREVRAWAHPDMAVPFLERAFGLHCSAFVSVMPWLLAMSRENSSEGRNALALHFHEVRDELDRELGCNLWPGTYPVARAHFHSFGEKAPIKLDVGIYAAGPYRWPDTPRRLLEGLRPNRVVFDFDFFSRERRSYSTCGQAWKMSGSFAMTLLRGTNRDILSGDLFSSGEPSLRERIGRALVRLGVHPDAAPPNPLLSSSSYFSAHDWLVLEKERHQLNECMMRRLHLRERWDGADSPSGARSGIAVPAFPANS
jgi:hypothetical protein